MTSYMGGATSLFPIFVLTTTPFILCDVVPTEETTYAPPFLSTDQYYYSSSDPFKPGTAVVLGVITTFSLTFLFLLYLKQCMDHNANVNASTNTQPSHVRKSSGVDRHVLESLPVFSFGSEKKMDGLDCAVCLGRFEDPDEVLRLLPKCKHVFHVECVDAWLSAHSTCPLCRYRVGLQQSDDVVNDVVEAVNNNDVVVLVDDDDDSRTYSSSSSTEVSGQNDDDVETASLDGAEHRIIVSPRPCSSSCRGGVLQQRWSDFQQRDVLEMVTWKARGGGSSSSNIVVGEVMERCHACPV